MKKIALLFLSLMLCIIPNSYTNVYALENETNQDKIMKIAFNGNVPKLEDDEIITISNDTVVIFDSRYDSIDDAVISPCAVPSDYDYYKTYQSGVTCKADGYSPTLDANITFYVNVFFKLDSNYSSKCVGYENPVVKSITNGYGASGYSNAKVTVTSYTSSKINLKGTCKLTAGVTLTLTGTKSISF